MKIMKILKDEKKNYIVLCLYIITVNTMNRLDSHRITVNDTNYTCSWSHALALRGPLPLLPSPTLRLL
jgi:hypothetical protein